MLGSVVVAWQQGGLTRQSVRDVAVASVQTCSLMGLIIIGATVLGNAVAFLGLPNQISEFVVSMHLSPMMLIAALVVLYLILGCFLEGFSMIVTTLPVVLPLITAAGFDKVWFGIFLVIAVEMAQITPPVGFNLFIINGLTNDGVTYIARVTLPFLIIMILYTFLLAAFPEIVLWLPNLLLGS